METIEHELTLALDASSATLAAAGLTPADVDISDIVVAAQRGCGGFEFVVREVHARLATRLRRAALISGEPGAPDVLCCMPSGRKAYRRHKNETVHEVHVCLTTRLRRAPLIKGKPCYSRSAELPALMLRASQQKIV